MNTRSGWKKRTVQKLARENARLKRMIMLALIRPGRPGDSTGVRFCERELKRLACSYIVDINPEYLYPEEFIKRDLAQKCAEEMMKSGAMVYRKIPENIYGRPCTRLTAEVTVTMP